MNGWNQMVTMLSAATNAKKDGGLYVKLEKDGDRVDVAFVGNDVKAAYVVYEQNRFVPFVAGKHDEKDKRFRVYVNVYSFEAGETKLFGASQQFAEELTKANHTSNLWQGLWRLQRRGEGPRTIYTLDHLRNLTPTELAKAQGASIFDLDGAVLQKYERIRQIAKPKDSFADDMGDIPF